MRLSVVYLTRGANQFRLLRVLRHDKPRINRDTVPANPRTRLQNIHARMAICQSNQFPDVDPLIGANQRQLIGEGDIDVTEAIFSQFAHFRRTGVGHDTFALKENVVQFASTRGTDGGHSPNHAVVFNQFNHHLARQHAFWTISNVNVSLFTDLLRESQIRTHFSQPCGHLFGSPDRRRRFKDHQRTFFQHRSKRLGCGFHINHVGFVLPLKRSRHSNQIGIRIYRGCGRTQKSIFDRRFHHGAQIWLNDMNFTAINGIHRVLIYIYANHMLLTGSKGSRRRQSDITQPNDRNGRKTHSDIRLFFNACKMRPHACPSPYGLWARLMV